MKFLHIELRSEDIAAAIGDLAKDAISTLSNLSINLALKVPNLLVAVIIGGIAAYYMMYDYDNIASTIKNKLSPKLNLLVDIFNKQALASFLKMIFSYILISAICFVELLISFLIIGIEDAVLTALIIALCDVLPILGSGAILIPWGIVSIILGNPAIGISLIVIWGIISIVRQVVEPKIVGSQIGLHPLVTIASLYIGLQLMGGLGLIVAPLYIITYKKFQEATQQVNHSDIE
jgi:sporulation integral membrane protein YtvI